MQWTPVEPLNLSRKDKVRLEKAGFICLRGSVYTFCGINTKANPVLLLNPGFLHYTSLNKYKHRLEKRCILRGSNHQITSDPFEGERGWCEDVRLQERSRRRDCLVWGCRLQRLIPINVKKSTNCRNTLITTASPTHQISSSLTWVFVLFFGFVLFILAASWAPAFKYKNKLRTGSWRWAQSWAVMVVCCCGAAGRGEECRSWDDLADLPEEEM